MSIRSAAVVAGVVTAVSFPVGSAFAEAAGTAPVILASSGHSSAGKQAEQLKSEAQSLPDGYKAAVVELTFDGGRTKDYRAQITRHESDEALLKLWTPDNLQGRYGKYVFTLSTDGKVTAQKNLQSTEALTSGYQADHYDIYGADDKVVGHETEISLEGLGTVLTLTAENPTGKHGLHSFAMSADGTVTATEDEGGDGPSPSPSPSSGGGASPAPSAGASTATTPPAGGNGNAGMTPAPTHDTRGNSHTPVVPKGGVRAGAEGVGSSDDYGLAAFGGGAAAAAAGLGFTVARKRRVES
ncbi:hypothetical protein ABT095_25525 [Kitasatospora sp. NPDC002227]|uniref:hypothetical protein n=1 Tax=Kitasatospora sp. NPDC002227 TaxID=3154773 RepID=UPI00332AD164